MAAILCFFLYVRFSSAYFSYFLIVAGIIFFFSWKFATTNNNEVTFSRVSLLLLGMGIFYGSILLDSILLQDIDSVKLSLEYASLTIPFFVFYLFRLKYNIDAGVRLGTLLASGAIFLLGFYQWYCFPSERVMSTFANPNHLGTMIAMMIPFFIYWGKQSKNRLERLAIVALILGGLLLMYATSSRGGMIALILGVCLSLLIFVFFDKNLSKRSIITIFALIGIVGIIGGYAVFNVQKERTGLGKIGGERIEMVEASYEMWNDHKLLGVGLDKWGDNYYDTKYHPVAAKEKGHTMPHNMPIYFFSTAGIIGGVGYIIFIFLNFIVLIHGFNLAEDKWLAIAMISAYLSFLIQGMVDTTIINKIPARIYFGLLGYSLAAIQVSFLGKEYNQKGIQ